MFNFKYKFSTIYLDFAFTQKPIKRRYTYTYRLVLSSLEYRIGFCEIIILDLFNFSTLICEDDAMNKLHDTKWIEGLLIISKAS